MKEVTTAGTLRLQHKLPCIANALVINTSAPMKPNDGVRSIFFDSLLVTTVNERDHISRR